MSSSLWIFTVAIIPALAIDYQSTLLSATITHYENEYLLFDVKRNSDEMYPYMIVNQPITPSNDLQLLVQATRSDGLEFLFHDNPLSLCYLLEDELLNQIQVASRLRVSRLFSLFAKTCPISEGTLRLSAYALPRNLSMEKDLGCGSFRFRTSLMKCKQQHETSSEECAVLIKSDMEMLMIADHCSSLDP